MKYFAFLSCLLCLSLLLSCEQPPKQQNKDKQMDFFIGTYSRDNSQGIYKSAITGEGKFTGMSLATTASDPSFLKRSANGKFLLAVKEQETGGLASYRIEGDSLKLISAIDSIGMHPCHISMNSNRWAVVSNYSSGNIVLFKLDEDGILKKTDTVLFTGKGEHPRQEAPHAHSTYFMKENTLISADLGTDKLWLNTITKEGDTMKMHALDSVKLTAGAGPRHIAFHPNKTWLYVINELNSTVTLVKQEEGTETLIPAGSYSTLPEDFEGESYCADIHIDQSGKFLYASNRGHQSIAIFRIDQQDGTLTPAGWEDVRGDWPRNFSLTPDNSFLIVANERSGNLVSFKRDTVSGTLTFADELKVPAPVCIEF